MNGEMKRGARSSVEFAPNPMAQAALPFEPMVRTVEFALAPNVVG